MFLHWFENFIKDQLTLNEYSINITRRTIVHNFKKPCQDIKVWENFWDKQNLLWSSVRNLKNVIYVESFLPCLL